MDCADWCFCGPISTQYYNQASDTTTQIKVVRCQETDMWGVFWTGEAFSGSFLEINNNAVILYMVFLVYHSSEVNSDVLDKRFEQIKNNLGDRTVY